MNRYSLKKSLKFPRASLLPLYSKEKYIKYNGTIHSISKWHCRQTRHRLIFYYWWWKNAIAYSKWFTSKLIRFQTAIRMRNTTITLADLDVVLEAEEWSLNILHPSIEQALTVMATFISDSHFSPGGQSFQHNNGGRSCSVSRDAWSNPQNMGIHFSSLDMKKDPNVLFVQRE